MKASSFTMHAPAGGQMLCAVLAVAGLSAISQVVAPGAIPDQSYHHIAIRKLVQPSRVAYLPFGPEEFIGYFADALQSAPKRIEEAAIFSTQTSGDHRPLQVIVSPDGRDLFVSVNGKTESALATVQALLGASFFTRDEVLGLRAALAAGGSSDLLKEHRFTASVTLVEHKEEVHVVLVFSPRLH